MVRRRVGRGVRSGNRGRGQELLAVAVFAVIGVGTQQAAPALARRLDAEPAPAVRPAAGHPDAKAARAFDIPAGEIGPVLTRWAELSELRLLASSQDLNGIRSAGLIGTYARDRALERLLAGTGLTYHFTNTSTVTIINPQYAQLGASPAEASTTLDEISVIGERQPRTFQQTLTSVTVLTEADVERRAGGDQTIYQVIRGAPNVTPAEPANLPTIRGLPTTASGDLAGPLLFGTQPRAALIVDEIARPSSYANTGFTSLFDVERVEVLRGPQSTLRGRNAIAGAFIVKTRDPTFVPEFVALGETAFDGIGGPIYRTGFAASGPIVPDVLAGRFVVEREGGNDPIRSLGGRSQSDTEQLTEYGFTRVRGKLLLTPDGPTGDLRSTLIAEYQDGTTPAFRGFVNGPALTGRPFGARIYNVPDYRIFDTQAGVIGLDTTMRLPDDWGEVQAITSFVKDRFVSAKRNVSPLVFGNTSDATFNQDLIWRFGDPTKVFSGLVGFTASERFGDFTAGSPFFFDGDARGSNQALFADLRYGLTSQLDVLFGGRLFRNVEDRNFVSVFGNVARTLEDRLFLPKVGLSYKLDEAGTQTVGATLRRGYNAGGGGVNFALGTPYLFESETVYTAELAYRAAVLDGKLIFGATGFYNWFDNQQFFLQRVAGDPFSSETVNIPKTESYGAEIESIVNLIPTLEIRTSLGLLHTEITEALPTNQTVLGNRFGRDPRVTASGGLVWTPVAGLAFDGRASYLSSYFSDFVNAPKDRAGDYIIVDLGASYTYNGVTGRVFVRNVTDELAFITRSGNDGAYLAPPRTVGVSLSARF